MKNLSIVAFLATVATMAAAEPALFAARDLRGGSATCDRKEVSTIADYDFEEFHAGDTIKELGGGDVTVRAFKIVKKTIKKPGKKKRTIKKMVKALPMAFDSANPTGGDWDLATNNQGMVLIVSEDGDSGDPDGAELGGKFVFNFKRSGAIVNSVSVLDAEKGGSIVVKRKNGRQQKFKIARVSNGKRTRVKINVADVQKITFEFRGSAAITNLRVTHCDAEYAPSASPSSAPSLAPSAAPSGSPSDAPVLVCPRGGRKPYCREDGCICGRKYVLDATTGCCVMPVCPYGTKPKFCNRRKCWCEPGFVEDEASGCCVGTPSAVPSSAPARAPSAAPSVAPSSTPTGSPSGSPSEAPVFVCSDGTNLICDEYGRCKCSAAPSSAPSRAPSAASSVAPRSTPTVSPSGSPSDAPVLVCRNGKNLICDEYGSCTCIAAPRSAPSTAPSSSPTACPEGYHGIQCDVFCAKVDYLTWCRAPDKEDQSCASICEGSGNVDNAAWFKAQNTWEKCQVLQEAMLLDGELPEEYQTQILETSSTCVELLPGSSFRCSFSAECSENHRTNWSNLNDAKGVCPCTTFDF